MTEHIAADDIDRIDESVGDRYPYPLVATYDRALFQAPDASEAHEYLLDLVEMTLKYLAVIVIAQYFRDGVPDATINRGLKDLERPSLGHWQGWLRDILRFYEHDDRVPVAKVRELYAKRHNGAIPIAVQGLTRVTAAMGSGAPVSSSDAATTHQFFNVLIAYRNRLAHGATPSVYDRANITEILAPAMRQLYAEMGFLMAYRLAYVRGVAVEFGTGDTATAKHRYRHQVTYLVGASPRASSTPRIGDEPVPDKQLYLLDQSEGFVPLLSLHPFLVFAHCASCNREQVFVLNATSATAQDYLAYQCTHHLRPTAYLEYMQRLLKQLDGDASAWDDEQRTTRWELLHKAEPQASAAVDVAPAATPAATPSPATAAPLPAIAAPLQAITHSAPAVAAAAAPPVSAGAAPPPAPAPTTLPPPPPPPSPSGPLPVLRVKGAGRDLVITADRQVIIGRESSSDIAYDDIRVSRKHAQIRCEGDHWVFEDLNSRNGTFVDGNRITRVPLTGHAAFRLGGATVGPILETSVQDASTPAPTASPSQPIPVAAAVPTPAAQTSAPQTPAGVGPGAPPPNKTVWTIGRTPGNDIVLADPTVSRHHAELRWNPTTGYELRDLVSHNGTFINGQHITIARLQGTDLVSIGNRRLRLAHGVLQEFADEEDKRLEVDDVTVRTQDNRVLLDHVSFALEANCFLAVVGPSGAGKTTLVNAMTGFRPADEGTVFYGDRDLYAEYDDLRRGIGYVPQDDILHTQLTVRQALQFTAELRFPEDVSPEERGRRVTEVINELGLSERADLVIEHLSGGQRKRANIGVELLTKPSPLFLDEPTSGLDPGLEKGVMTMLRGLADGGRTVIIVTHSQQSLQLCDRVLFLAPGGRTAYFGPPEGALRYFGKTDMADVFTDLEQHSSVAWDERFRASPEYDTYVRRPMSGHEATAPPPPPRATPTRPPGIWKRQTWTLLKRYVAATASDRRNLILLLIQAPLLAILMLAALGSDSFSHPNVLAQMVVTVAVLTVTLTGLLNSIREIVKEFPIYQRERFVGLSIRAYILSKLGVLAPLTILQAVILVVIGFARQPVHGSASALGSPELELIVDLAFAGLAAMSLGLLVSAMMRSADKAISVLILIVVGQLIMSIPLLQISSKPVLGQLSWLSSAKWGVDAVGSTVNLNTVQPTLSGADPAWAHTAGTWFGDIGMLVLLTVAALAGTAWLLKRRDPSLLSAPHAAISRTFPAPPPPPPAPVVPVDSRRG
jgi:ABC-type multidrug transport system ATPase subunit